MTVKFYLLVDFYWQVASKTAKLLSAMYATRTISYPVSCSHGAHTSSLEHAPGVAEVY